MNRVNTAKYYPICFDETSDLSGKAQVTFILRYVDFSSEKLEPVLMEDFVGFVDAFGDMNKNDKVGLPAETMVM